ncbi:MAG: anthrone oxygenase family protein [Bacteroidota bacterium]
MNSHQLLYGTSILLTGLLAGLFYGYQCSVINGLGALGNKEYLLSFQSIDKYIQNPVFFLSFMGSLIVLPIASYVFYKSGNYDLFPYVITATTIYAIGVFGITAACNVPLNEMLRDFDIQSATENQLQEIRMHFETSWNNWHFIRTLASIASFITLIIPLLKKI